ncbi:hypothetical protein CLHOM_04360 [Clostridium homopropionicum DSM 5847]|uniref:Uncharacterized protein n=1 Tax=Clostridium homopropionicum DSM 5847 TaxID=1121318 RepID=A0A0L6ZEA7_9CLOT|nr:hypothetical protein [Clostridium homopropionicum]KOA21306.1 hypothetical protein CLHOM_04360 [Clostridium homopropionicum DSM 5847]SFG30610.1 hypothetical protein SAMN04488501_107183 [Clostridium homopropionicum]
MNENAPSSLKNYVKNKEKEIQSLAKTIEMLKEEIEQKEEILLQRKSILEHEKLDETLLTDKFNSLYRIVKERGIFLVFHVQKHNLKEWDNLFVGKNGNKNLIINKNGEIIGELDKDIIRIFNKEIKEKKYSILVVRVNTKVIKARLVVK